MKDWIVPVLVALIGGGLSGGLVPLVQAFRGRGRSRADTAEAFSKMSREWAATFEAEATAARAETAALRADLRRCASEAHAIADELRRLRLAILHPAASIDGLRELVRAGRPPGENGYGGVDLNRH